MSHDHKKKHLDGFIPGHLLHRIARLNPGDLACLQTLLDTEKLYLKGIKQQGNVRQLTAGGTPQIDIDPQDNDKPTVIALREVAAGKVGLEMLNRGQA